MEQDTMITYFARIKAPLLAALLLPGMALAELPAAPGDDPLRLLMAGEFALQAGNAPAAAELLLGAARGRNSLLLAERAARVALLAERPATAAQAIELWRARAGDRPPASLLQIEAAMALARQDDALAVEALAALLDREDESGWQLAVQALAGNGDPGVAARVIGLLLDREALPASDQAWFAFGGLSRRLDAPALSTRLAEQAISRFPDSARVWLWQAERLRADGRGDAAREAVARAVRIEPDDPSLLLGAAAELDALGDAAAAAALLEGRLDEPALVFGRLAYLARGEDDAGLAVLYTELERDAEAAGPARPYLLGQLSELLERPREGLEWYAQVTDPERRPQAELRQAVLLEQLDRLDEALERLHLIQVGDDADAGTVRDSYLLEGELLMRRDRHQQAIAAYGRGLAIFDDEPQLLYARALLHAELGEVVGAERDLRRLIELDPEDPNALNALGYTLADLTDRHDEALELIERALELEPEAAAIIDSMGWVLYRMGRTAEARGHLERAFELQPDAEIAAHLGEVLYELGEVDLARETWRKGAEIDPDNAVLERTRERYVP